MTEPETAVARALAEQARALADEAQALAEEAQALAEAAAARHGVRMVELHTALQHHDAADLFARIWQADSPDSVMGAAMMTAIAHAGGYVVGAYRGDELIGGAVGFLGPGFLHSHVTGVDRPARGLGFAIKQHQRAWCLARGIEQVRWTYDPLVARNAYFNLHRLAARAVEYLADFYGPMVDGLNAGDATDRLYVHWDLRSEPARQAARGQDAPAPPATDAVAVVDRTGEPDRPVPAAPPGDGRPRLVAVPHDIEALRRQDAELAALWRQRVRAALVAGLADGYRITAMSRDGFYTLQKAPQGTVMEASS